MKASRDTTSLSFLENLFRIGIDIDIGIGVVVIAVETMAVGVREWVVA